VNRARHAVPVVLTVNGRERTGVVEPRRSLADFLREDLGLTGIHLGCEHGVCGACTVLVDGRPARACLTLAVEAAGAAVTTVEGVAPDGALHPIQQALADAHGLQCGFCTPGIVMVLYALWRDAPDAPEAEILDHLGGNLCRCTGYRNILAAAATIFGKVLGHHLEAENACRLEETLDTLTQDCVVKDIPLGERVTGHDGVARYYQR
jgi:carbon-monoxide dehydrogenase small subunit